MFEVERRWFGFKPESLKLRVMVWNLAHGEGVVFFCQGECVLVDLFGSSSRVGDEATDKVDGMRLGADSYFAVIAWASVGVFRYGKDTFVKGGSTFKGLASELVDRIEMTGVLGSGHPILNVIEGEKIVADGIGGYDLGVCLLRAAG